jgi:predicted ester cyclase
MSFARVITFEYKPNTLNVLTQKVKDGLLPLLQKSPGFLSYVRVVEKDNKGVAVGTWQTREQAESATKQATQWLKDNIGDMAVKEDAVVGEVSLETSIADIHKAVIEAIYDAFNSKDISRLAGLTEPGAKITNVAFGNLEQPIRDYFQNWATAFPDGKIEIARIIASDEGVMCEYTGRGTHTGVLQTHLGPIQPTNKRVEGSMVEIYRFRNGKVASSRVYFDPINLLQRLGIPLEKLPARKPEGARPEARH